MKRYAIIQNNLVVNVIDYDFLPTNPPPGFDNTYIAIQSDIASVGYTYVDEVFSPPQPYPSWILVNNIWTPPIPQPTNGIGIWNESTKSWKIY